MVIRSTIICECCQQHVSIEHGEEEFPTMCMSCSRPEASPEVSGPKADDQWNFIVAAERRKEDPF